jgi:hypothetical protein
VTACPGPRRGSSGRIERSSGELRSGMLVGREVGRMALVIGSTLASLRPLPICGDVGEGAFIAR